MTQPLRSAHRLSFLLLSVLLPALLVAGLLARRPLVRAEPASDRITLRMPNGTELVADSRELWGAFVDSPDLLVYSTEAPTMLEALPVTAHLLGSLAAARKGGLRVPGSNGEQGYLILYSLAWQKPVALAPFPKEMP